MSKGKKQILLLSAIFFVACLGSLAFLIVLRAFLSDQDLAAISSPNPSNQAQELSPIPVESRPIPGLTRESTNHFLQSHGYDCTLPQMGELGLYHWVCWQENNEDLLEIYFFSRSTDSIDFIDANINQPEYPSDQKAVDFLTFVGTLPENDSADEQIRSWIAQTLPDIERARDLREKDLGGVHYRLYGLADARSLEIGILPIIK